MSKLKDVKTVETIFLNGKPLIMADQIGCGEVEEYGVRFRLFGRKKIEALELLYDSPDPFSSSMKEVVEVIAAYVKESFTEHLTVYYDLDEERFLK
ncbi:hypothetical protein [Salisediminibacterium beveridgei]|uniref:Uncharacterized protein n=1 Tax=Salisediminibacterium beveridgei TaxID=632773 RepID=A0A1D7QWZ2_9BACI|nr:hypothetical protein [Salisediminibacterium beveridgei]AOM83536.1 hypothetical protein BBEV_2178 [Salisediminibacterium beveridgei]